MVPWIIAGAVTLVVIVVAAVVVFRVLIMAGDSELDDDEIDDHDEVDSGWRAPVRAHAHSR
jgi:hypothetical protein